MSFSSKNKHEEEMTAKPLVIFALVAAAVPASARAQSVADFYKHKPLTMTVGQPVGGYFDVQARTVARHLGKFIQGSPTIVVRNMPGAGGIQSANYLFNTAPRDGSEILHVAGTVAFVPLFGIPSHYEAQKFTWLGGSGTEYPATCFVWHTSKIKSGRDLFDKEAIVGSAGTSNLTTPNALNEIVGTKIKIVRGYTGVNTIWLAMERGEVEGICGTVRPSLTATHPQWLAEKKVRPVLTVDLHPGPGPKEADNVLDFVKTDEQRQLLKLIYGSVEIQRPFAAPPDIPADRAAALRQAFIDMANDPAFIQDAARSGLDYRVITAGQIASVIDENYRAPKDLIERAGKILNQN
jgi:tripartite-type tricarboxylate transporter receptor subunit TctC